MRASPDMGLMPFAPPALDYIFPSDNSAGIPTLDRALQAHGLVAPIRQWGRNARRRAENVGTVHFYTDDYRFEALWKSPDGLLAVKPHAIIEPNFSCYGEMPAAAALWQTYRKRWLARFWQLSGIQVIVDMNVATVHRTINLIGVPRGWRAYASRLYLDTLELVLEEYEMACQHAETSDILFVAYGGGSAGLELAREHNWLWINDTATQVKLLQEGRSWGRNRAEVVGAEAEALMLGI